MKILLLGSSGFLGREVRRVFGPDVTLIPVSHSGRGGSRAVDIRNGAALRGLVDDTKPDVVLLLAAYREPDVCEADPEEARRLNVAPAKLLTEYLPGSTRLLFVSTDYVFDGENAPYTEDSSVSPVSVYGETKVEAEAAIKGRANTTILRIPLLIGGGSHLSSSGFIGQMVEAIRASEHQKLDDVLMRFPTWTRDVAGAVRFLVEKETDGLFHYSAPRGATRYAWTLETAKIIGLSAEHFTPSKEVVQRKARRPFNSQLNDSKIQSLGYTRHTDFHDVVRTVIGELK
ncbi:MAG: SDR family oxidoreductase [Kiritimatiellae bacterium]|nr:SDR family oxidoreductase [Kiritimatiellia bacterium]